MLMNDLTPLCKHWEIPYFMAYLSTHKENITACYALSLMVPTISSIYLVGTTTVHATRGLRLGTLSRESCLNLGSEALADNRD